jgi:excisionase family DNA binding protein
MGNDEQDAGSRRPVFYTVAEAADMMRVDRTTIYRAIREDAFPAVRVRNRYIVPATAVEELAAEATQSGACVDVAAIAARRRREREAAHAIALDGGARDWRA